MKPNVRNILIIFFICILALSVWNFSHIIWHMLIAVVLSLIGHPLVNAVEKLRFFNRRLPRAVAAALTLLVIWSVIIGMLSLLVPMIVREAKLFSNIDVEQLADYFADEFNQVKEHVNFLKKNSDPEFSFETYLQSKLETYVDITYITNLANSVTSALGDIFVAFFSISFMTFFFLKDDRLWANIILTLTPDKHVAKMKNIMKVIKKLLVRYFVGLVLDVSIVMSLNTLWLTIIGLTFGQALVIGFITGLLNVVPYIGPLMGSVLGVMLGTAITVEAGMYDMILPRMLYFGIAFLGTQILDATMLQPYIYSNSVKAHPLEIFLVIMSAGSLAGITGMILAIPTYTLFRVIAREFLSQFKIVRALTKNI